MKYYYQYIFIVAMAISFSSCYNETIEPAKNPRFSVPSILHVDDVDLHFSANVYDLGGEEIIEHGFAYSTWTQPRKENSEFVSAHGRPSNSFEMKTNHKMEKGKKYYAIVFMRTSTGLVYSSPVPVNF